jgi:hypothetical protein
MAEQTPWEPTPGSAPPPPPPPAPPVPPTPVKPPYYERRGGIGVGIILIALGIVFLVAQFVPGMAWWMMWPLFIILLGGIQIVTPDPREGWGINRVMDGIGTVLIGLVLLGNTTGYISWTVWWTLLTLWPVLLIAGGIAIVGRALNQSWIRAIAPLVIWAALAYAVGTALTGQTGYRPLVPITFSQQGQAFDLAEPLGNIKIAKLTFDGGAGNIKIARTSRDLVTAQGRSPFGSPSLVVERSGETADVRFGLGDKNSTMVGPGFTAGQVDVGLNDSVTWDATLNTGASSLNADLSGVLLSSLTLKTGVSSAELRLGAVPSGQTRVPVEIKAGVSSVTVLIPKGTQARVRSSSGLSALSVSDDLTKNIDGTWTTGNPSGSLAFYDISVESGVGSVSIQTY